MSYVVIIAITAVIGILGFVFGLNIGRRQGEAVGKYKIVSLLKLFINKILELVPPDKYKDLQMQVEYLYSQINKE